VPAQLSLWDRGPAEEAAKELRVQQALATVAARLERDMIRRMSQLPPLVPKE